MFIAVWLSEIQTKYETHWIGGVALLTADRHYLKCSVQTKSTGEIYKALYFLKQATKD